jgi:transcriptional regulator GlxA family with amidase domain
VEDKGIYTSAGVTAGIDLALHIVSVLKDDNFSFKIARELVVYNRRSGSDAQQSIHLSYRNHIHSGIHKVQDWLQDNLNKALNIIDLAAIANMSDRNFTRIFKKETSLTVHEYITLLRKERLTALLKNPDLSRQQIAQQCGLASERQLSRLIKQS